MKIKEVYIKNFRSLRDVRVNCDRLTVLIGPNSTGKSSFISALKLFFTIKGEYRENDFYGCNTSNGPIIIEVIFDDLSPNDRQEFNRHLNENNKNELVIRKKCTYPYGRGSQTYYNINNEEIKDIEDIIEKKFKFIYLPAVREASIDATEERGSHLNELLKDTLTKKNIINALSNDNEYKDKYNNLINYVKQNYEPEFEQIEKKLTDIISQYIPNTSIKLKLHLEKDVSSIIKTEAYIVENRLELPIELTGHGAQRIYIITILEYLARYSSGNSADNDSNTKTLIFAIEEPELYQHPSRQRHLASILQELTENQVPNYNFQIIYSTHSPFLVDITRFNQIRRFYKKPSSNEYEETCIAYAMLRDISEKLCETEENLRSKLRLTPQMNDGFFADKVVLVEGDEDKAIIHAIAKVKGITFDDKNIVIIPCNGKDNIRRAFVIFKALSIPVYPIWDLDQKPHDKTNKRLAKLVGKESLNDTTIEEEFACFKPTLSAILKNDIGNNFDKMVKKYKKEFAIKRNPEKNPTILQLVIEEAYKNGNRSDNIEQVINKIVNL